LIARAVAEGVKVGRYATRLLETRRASKAEVVLALPQVGPMKASRRYHYLVSTDTQNKLIHEIEENMYWYRLSVYIIAHRALSSCRKYVVFHENLRPYLQVLVHSILELLGYSSFSVQISTSSHVIHSSVIVGHLVSYLGVLSHHTVKKISSLNMYCEMTG